MRIILRRVGYRVVIAIIFPHPIAKPAIAPRAAELFDPPMLIRRHRLRSQLPAKPVGFFGDNDAFAECRGDQRSSDTTRAAADDEDCRVSRHTKALTDARKRGAADEVGY